MLIAYCEKCGFRVPHDDIESGAVLKIEEKYYCVKCSATMPKRPPTKATNVRHTPDHQLTARSGEAKAFAGRPPSGPAHIIAGTPSARTSSPGATGTRAHSVIPKPAAKNNSGVVIGGIIAGVVGLGLILISLRKPEPKPGNRDTSEPEKTASTPATTVTSGSPAVASPTPPVTAPLGGTPAKEPVTVDANPATALSERQRNADREMEALRLERGSKSLEQAKKWFADRPGDPWAYQEKLKQIAMSYRATAPGLEAEKLLAELKIPDGERSPDSFTWPRDWDVFAGSGVDVQEVDGRKAVLHSHPMDRERPFVMRRSVKVPVDRPILAIEMRGTNDGDCHLIFEVNGRILINEPFRGQEWRSYALDLSPLKGQDAEISLQHHNSDWHNEHAWWTAPRFVAVAVPGAKLAAFETASIYDVPPGSISRDASFESARKGSWFYSDPSAIVASDARSGSHAARLGPNSSFEQTVLGLKPGTSYILTGWGKCPAGDDARIGVKEYGGGEAMKTVNTPEYARYEVPFTTGTSNTSAVIYFWKPGGTQNAFGDDFAVLRDGAAPATIPVATPVTQTAPTDVRGSYRQLFDGKTLNVLLRQGFKGWNVENGLLVNTGTEKTSAQTDIEIENGSVRVRFDFNNIQYAQFTIRQSGAGGYTVAFDRSQIPSMVGKPQELIFTCRGDEVSATLNGKPAKIGQTGKSSKGRLQFYAKEGLMRVSSIEFSESTTPVDPGAGTVVATTPVANNAAILPDIKLEYDIAASESYALLARNAVPQALARLEKAKADPRLATYIAALNMDLEFAKSIEQSAADIQKGIEALADKRAFNFVKTDGKEFSVGKGSKGAVVGFRNNVIQLEQDLGGGKAMARIAVDQLAPRTRYELIQLGTPPGPEGDLKTAFSALLALGPGPFDTSSREVAHRLELAEKAKAPPAKIAHLRERLQALERNASAEAAYKKAETLVREKKHEEAKKAFDLFKTDFADTRTFAAVKGAMEQKIAEIDAILRPLSPGLWATYMSGNDQNRFLNPHLSRAELKLNWDAGEASPAPGVPVDFAIRYRGILRIEREGRYGFFGWCDDSVTITIDGKVILSGGMNNNEGEITLAKGDHAIKVDCWDGGGPGKLDVKWRMVGGFDLQEIPSTVLWHDPKEKAKYEKE